MTHGTISAMIIKDMILGIKNPWAEIYDPARFKIKNNLTNKTLQKEKDLQEKNEVKKEDMKNLSLHLKKLNQEEGRILKINDKKIAVFKDKYGTGYFLYPLCPHMGCLLRWNNAEKSWDCPCHGSRFTFEGKVLNSPAYENLQTIAVLKAEP
jgi:Rieske Fe-S protein